MSAHAKSRKSAAAIISCHEMEPKVKYIAYRNLTFAAGISHHRSNFEAMAKEAAIADRVLIAPEFKLAAHHNHGRALVTNLSEYYDLENVFVDDRHVRIEREFRAAGESLCQVKANVRIELLQHAVVSKEMKNVQLARIPLQSIYPTFRSLKSRMTIHPKLLGAAQEALAKVPTDTVWIHVRRGDLTWKTGRATSPHGIDQLLRTKFPQTTCLYIATNERSLSHFEPLRQRYTVMMARDLALPPEITQNNYMLYLVEHALGELLQTRVSTFRVPGGKYHASLTEQWGWQ